MREVSQRDLDASYGLYPAGSVLELGEAASGEIQQIRTEMKIAAE